MLDCMGVGQMRYSNSVVTNRRLNLYWHGAFGIRSLADSSWTFAPHVGTA